MAERGRWHRAPDANLVVTRMTTSTGFFRYIAEDLRSSLDWAKQERRRWWRALPRRERKRRIRNANNRYKHTKRAQDSHLRWSLLGSIAVRAEADADE